MVGILQGEALVGEEADHVVLEHGAYSVARLTDGKSDVGACVDATAGVVEARGMRLVGGVDGKFRRAPHGGGVELRLQVPIVGEGGVLLCPCHVPAAAKQQKEPQNFLRTLGGDMAFCSVHKRVAFVGARGY